MLNWDTEETITILMNNDETVYNRYILCKSLYDVKALIRANKGMFTDIDLSNVDWQVVLNYAKD